MLFNSIDFAVFLPIVFILFWLANKKSVHLANLVILGASYIFYGWWDWRFLALIIVSTMVDFSIGLHMPRMKNKTQRTWLLMASIFANLSILGFFKYYNFFLNNFKLAFIWLGFDIAPNGLDIVLPVGISFYTFQTLSYSIDIYRERISPTSDFISFAAFVSFFPQLVAGPIERAANLLPQFAASRKFDTGNAVNGLRQILWGFFKKVLIADNCATYANLIFGNSGDYSGSTLLLGAVFFAFQIYGDFSGYSDIAIGVSRLFGFRLMQNFNFPYFSRDIGEFWRRWHISLSTWFRDYMYIPMGGSRTSKLGGIRNTLLIFVVSGFWHGANWTFIFWGILHATFFIPLLITGRNRRNLENVRSGLFGPSLTDFIRILVTFFMVTLAWILFRADNIHHAISIFGSIFSKSIFTIPHFRGMMSALETTGFIIFFILIEWRGRHWAYGIEKLGLNWPRYLRLGFYYILIIMVMVFGNFSENEFIYFQF
ncbi:MAG: MBOAT family O-acyltransferase [Fulvivirga sp.]